MRADLNFFGPLAFYALTKAGADLTLQLAAAWETENPAALETCRIFWPERLRAIWAEKALRLYPVKITIVGFQRFSEALAENFNAFAGQVIVGAAGIAVRALAPLISHKTIDPAVVVMGQDGRFAISLLSGHLGGANQLARRLAAISGGQPVITTATDLAGQPALEMLAKEQGLTIEDYRPLAAISRALVEGGRVKVHDPGAFLSPALTPWPDSFDIITGGSPTGPAAEPLIWVDHFTENIPEKALLMRPKSLAVAMGCHRGIKVEDLRGFFYETLARHGLSPLSVGILASVDSRAEEPALLALAAELGCPYKTFSKAELAKISIPNPSDKVLAHIGVESVCEAAVLLASRASRLLISKRKGGTATLAAAVINSI